MRLVNSRQQAWQDKMRELKRCTCCGKSLQVIVCALCRKQRNEHMKEYYKNNRAVIRAKRGLHGER